VVSFIGTDAAFCSASKKKKTKKNKIKACNTNSCAVGGAV
jgi:NADH:ubiquinone oxidoreductase subunit E